MDYYSKERKLGFHVGKDTKGYYKTIINIESNFDSQTFKWKYFPIQIFTGSTKSWKRGSINEKDCEKTKKYIIENEINCFIHSIYLINLSRIGEEFQKAQDCLKYDLLIGSKLGVKGVVVHVGKALKMGTNKALDNMYKNIILLLPHINESCPLLIETPAGQGTEVLTKIEDFMDFYDKFNQDEKKKVKICIDTCHVYASGYDPEEYLIKWYSRFPKSLVLVHFNDSKTECGSCKDRHAVAGEGHIGIEKLNNISIWCSNLDIPMIREY